MENTARYQSMITPFPKVQVGNVTLHKSPGLLSRALHLEIRYQKYDFMTNREEDYINVIVIPLEELQKLKPDVTIDVIHAEKRC